MADDATDSAFGLVMFLLFLGLIAYAVGSTGATTSGSTTKTTTPGYTSTPSPVQPQGNTSNIPGGPLSSCSGKVIANKTKSTSDGSLNVKLYFSSVDGDRNCVVVTRRGWPAKMQGRMTAKLWFTDYGGAGWPEYAVGTIQPHGNRVTGVYLDDTYNRCVSASGSYAPYNGMSKITVKVGPVGCN